MRAVEGATLARAALVGASLVAVGWSLAVVARDGPRRAPRFMSDIPMPPARSRLTEIVFRTPGQIRPATDWPHQMRARLFDAGHSGSPRSTPQPALWQRAPALPPALPPTIPAEWVR